MRSFASSSLLWPEQRRRRDSPVVIYRHTHTHNVYTHMYTRTHPQNLVWFNWGAASCFIFFSFFLQLVIILSWTASTRSLSFTLTFFTPSLSPSAQRQTTTMEAWSKTKTKQNLNPLLQGALLVFVHCQLNRNPPAPAHRNIYPLTRQEVITTVCKFGKFNSIQFFFCLIHHARNTSYLLSVFMCQRLRDIY